MAAIVRGPPLRRWLGLAVTIGLMVAAMAALRPGEREAVPAPIDRLWSVDMRQIVQITVVLPRTGATAVWNRKGAAWQSVPDRRGSARARAWQSGTPLLLSRPQVRAVATRRGDPSRFGFDAPRLAVRIVLADGARRQALVGDRLPDGTGYYVTAGRERIVYAIDPLWVRVLERLPARSVRERTFHVHSGTTGPARLSFGPP